VGWGGGRGGGGGGEVGRRGSPPQSCGRLPPQALGSVSLLTHLRTYLQALGSVSVLVSGLVIKFGEAWGPRRFLADPLASLLIVLILLRGAVPLVRQCVRRLLAEPEPEPEPAAPSDCPA